MSHQHGGPKPPYKLKEIASKEGAILVREVLYRLNRGLRWDTVAPDRVTYNLLAEWHMFGRDAEIVAVYAADDSGNLLWEKPIDEGYLAKEGIVFPPQPINNVTP